jgi:hypothetical protein
MKRTSSKVKVSVTFFSLVFKDQAVTMNLLYV